MVSAQDIETVLQDHVMGPATTARPAMPETRVISLATRPQRRQQDLSARSASAFGEHWTSAGSGKEYFVIGLFPCRRCGFF